MNDNIDMNAASLADFLGRIGLPPVARDRVLEIDRTLASELASDQPDVNGCAALVIEAADLIAAPAMRPPMRVAPAVAMPPATAVPPSAAVVVIAAPAPS